MTTARPVPAPMRITMSIPSDPTTTAPPVPNENSAHTVAPIVAMRTRLPRSQ